MTSKRRRRQKSITSFINFCFWPQLLLLTFFFKYPSQQRISPGLERTFQQQKGKEDEILNADE